MNTGDRPIELQHEVGVVVNRPVFTDVELATVENHQFRILFLELGDLLALRPHLLACGSVDSQILTVVGNRHVLIAAGRGSFDHLGKGGTPITRQRRVIVQVTLDVFELHKVGQLTGYSGLDLAVVLPHGGSNQRQTELGIDLLLGFGRDHLVGLNLGESVFVEQQTSIDGQLAKMDVVGLGSSEVEEGGAVLGRSHHPQVNLQTSTG